MKPEEKAPQLYACTMRSVADILADPALADLPSAEISDAFFYLHCFLLQYQAQVSSKLIDLLVSKYIHEMPESSLNSNYFNHYEENRRRLFAVFQTHHKEKEWYCTPDFIHEFQQQLHADIPMEYLYKKYIPAFLREVETAIYGPALPMITDQPISCRWLRFYTKVLCPVCGFAAGAILFLNLFSGKPIELRKIPSILFLVFPGIFAFCIAYHTKHFFDKRFLTYQAFFSSWILTLVAYASVNAPFNALLSMMLTFTLWFCLCSLPNAIYFWNRRTLFGYTGQSFLWFVFFRLLLGAVWVFTYFGIGALILSLA